MEESDRLAELYVEEKELSLTASMIENDLYDTMGFQSSDLAFMLESDLDDTTNLLREIRQEISELEEEE